MSHAYLEVTFRKGRLLAAYYYLPRRPEDRCVRVERHGPGFVVDLSADGRPLGIELALPYAVDTAALNAVLAHYGLSPLDPAELAPLQKAA